MSDYDINKMDFKQLRNEVQLLRDELAIMQRKYEDLLYNLDEDNFSMSFLRKSKNAIAKITFTAEEISTYVERIDDLETNYSQIRQTADEINLKVVSIQNDVTENRAEITANAAAIELKVSETDLKTQLTNYSTIEQTAKDINAGVTKAVEDAEGNIKEYYTGIGITSGEIKMSMDTGQYSAFTEAGLRFYDSSGQVEGWAIEPNALFGGELNYYYNSGLAYTFGSGLSGSGYTSTDIVLKANDGNRGRFVVDVANSGNGEVKFVGLNTIDSDENQPAIYANSESSTTEKLLATQDWVIAQGITGGGIAVFG